MTYLQRQSQSAVQHDLVKPSFMPGVLRSSGQPLDAETRVLMESRFGHDFSGVRVHTDAPAAESARAVNALAYTVGRDVIFGVGQYAPFTSAGRRLLAHELTHVVQQQGTSHEADTPLHVSMPHDAAEQEATHNATSMGGQPISHVSAGALQRQSSDSSSTLGRFGGGADSTDADAALLWESFRQSITLDNFALDKSDLTADHEDKLKEFKQRFQVLLGRHPDSTISVIGHTDATGTEAHNKALGQERADTVKNALTSGDNALPVVSIFAGSLGESMPAAESKGPEARNRRVEIIPRLRQSFQMPLPKPPTSLPGFPSANGGDPNKRSVPGDTPGPFVPNNTPKIPDLKLKPHNWFKDALENDPIVKSLPPWMRNKVVDAVKDGDEMLAEKVIDALPLDPKAKAAVQAVVKSILQMAKGKKFEVPTPQLHELPPSVAPPFPKAPGEVIIPGPTFRF